MSRPAGTRNVLRMRSGELAEHARTCYNTACILQQYTAYADGLDSLNTEYGGELCGRAARVAIQMENPALSKSNYAGTEFRNSKRSLVKLDRTRSCLANCVTWQYTSLRKASLYYYRLHKGPGPRGAC